MSKMEDAVPKMLPMPMPTVEQVCSLPMGTEVIIVAPTPGGLVFDGRTVNDELLQQAREAGDPLGIMVIIYVLPDEIPVPDDELEALLAGYNPPKTDQ